MDLPISASTSRASKAWAIQNDRPRSWPTRAPDGTDRDNPPGDAVAPQCDQAMSLVDLLGLRRRRNGYQDLGDDSRTH